MATLVLQTAGAVIGSFVGGPLGAAIGGTIGTAVGSVIDQSLISGALQGGRKTIQGSRLKDLDGISASEGSPIPRLYGRARLGGQIIWATRFEEEVVVSRVKSRGGKGGIGGGLGKGQKQVSYRYFANVAIGLCEGEIAFVRRVWFDGKPLDLTSVTMRVHRGSQIQSADPLIVAKQGAADTPAYRGLAYVVFERLPIEAYGNRLPQMTFEVVRPVHGLCSRIRAVNLIPGAGEHVYETSEISLATGVDQTSLPNRTQLTHNTNWHASLDALQALCPMLEHVALVVAWYGNDLRASHCMITPRTEPGALDALNRPWGVAGLTRTTANTVSLSNGSAAFGGTPSDKSVIGAITDLKARGLKVTLYPFIMMDIPADNQLLNPWSGTTGQPAYPWRGRITCNPAPGLPQSVDSTISAASQIATFMGNAIAAQFQITGGEVIYSGSSQSWGLSRFILHMAMVAQAAGGVDAFVLTSELVSLTRVRATTGVNPAVAGLKTIAAQARLILGQNTRITYGADWTEYSAEVRNNGADIRFPLDPLWSDPNVDAVAIDWYPPVTDWRDGTAHLDALAYDGPYDQQMYADRVAGGEAFDWYYSNSNARIQQARLPITDGAYNKPWIYRPKDIASWWSQPHFERTNGVEQTLATSWIPQSKPVWLLELGCPAIDRGANAPNVFPDPKSSENAAPYFSRNARDDAVQSRHLVATIDHYVAKGTALATPVNLISSLYNGPMIDPERIYLWAYDARPFPAFPDHSHIWADADAFETGHWLNGRIEGAAIDDLMQAVLADFGHVTTGRISADGFVEGYVLDRPMSIRAALEPLSGLFGFDAVVLNGDIAFSRRSSRPLANLNSEDCVVVNDQDSPHRVRVQASELPTALSLAFNDPDSDFRQAVVRVSVSGSEIERELALEIPVAIRRSVALQRASVLLNEIRGMRESIRFSLPPSQLLFQPGDNLQVDGASYRIKAIVDGLFRTIEAVAISPQHYLGAVSPSRPRRRSAPLLAGLPTALVLDLPYADSPTTALQYIAASVDPWPGSLTLWRSHDGSSFEAVQQLLTRATIGQTLTMLAPGPLWITDRVAMVDIKLAHGSLESVNEIGLLQGINTIAIGTPASGWEILSFANAELIANGHWRLSRFIRGLAGSETLASVAKPIGSYVVFLDGGIHELATSNDLINSKLFYRLSAEGRDHADANALRFETTAGPLALLPYSPQHAKARRVTGGVEFSWIRRTRFGGDSWELAEVPLNEEQELYEVEILDGSQVKRRLSSNGPSVIYTLPHELADFGAPQANLTIRLRQISAAAGPGFSASFSLRVS